MMVDEPSIHIDPPVSPVSDVDAVDGPPDPSPSAPTVIDTDNAMQFVQGPFVQNVDGTIDCEIFHARFGWIPFTASSADPDEHGRVIHEVLLTHLGVV